MNSPANLPEVTAALLRVSRQSRKVGDLEIFGAPVRSSSPFARPWWMAAAGRVSLSASVAFLAAQWVQLMLGQTLPAEAATAIGLVLTFPIMATGRWWARQIIEPIAGDTSRRARRWMRNHEIDNAARDGLITTHEAMEEKRRLFFEDVRNT